VSREFINPWPGLLSARTLENAIFGIFLFSLVAIFSVNLSVNFTLPKLLVLRVGTLTLCILALFRFRGGQSADIPAPVLFSVSTLLLWWVISTFFAIHLPTAIHGFHGRYNGLLNQGVFLLLFFIIALSGYPRERIETLLKIFIAAMTPAALYAILQHFHLDPFDWPSTRPGSTIGNPVILAATLGLAVPFGICFLFISRSKVHKIIIGILLTMVIAAMMLTMGRGPIVGLLVSSAFVMVVALKQRLLSYRNLFFSVAVLLALCAALLLSNKEFRASALTRIPSYGALLSDSSVLKRLDYFDAALHMIKDHPLFGVGFENFRILYPRYRPPQDHTTDVIPTMVHNGYIERAVANGIPGLGLYLTSIFSIIALLVSSARKTDDAREHLLIAAFLGAIAGYLVQDLSGWQELSFSAFFWIMAGLAVGYSNSLTAIHAKNGSSGRFESIVTRVVTVPRQMLVAGMALSIAGLLFLSFEACKRVRADVLFSQASQMNPVDEWSELELLATTGMDNAQNNYFYQDKAGLIFTKRFAATRSQDAYAKAMHYFEDAFRNNPFDSYIVLHALELDAIALNSGVIQRPSQLTEKGIQVITDIDRNNPQIFEMIGKFYVQAKNYPEALKWLSKLQQSGMTGVSSDLLEGEIARRMGDKNRALLVLRKAIRKMEQNNSYDQQWANTKLVVASIEMEMKLTDSALQGTLDVSNGFPKEVKSYILRGDIYAINNDLSGARDSYKEALSIEPSNQFAKRGFEAAEKLLRRSQ
jgi:O-antigen ligase/predicted negative regulator of RcsB-dependent stress response